MDGGDVPLTIATWALVVATLVGAGLVFGGLIDGARARKEQNDILRKRETLRMYVHTVRQRTIAGQVLPLDRDRRAIARLIRIAQTPTRRGRRTHRAIREYLNYWEAVARGVEGGVLDEDLIRRLAQGRVIAAVENYRPFIAWRRRAAGSDALWIDIERLADRWRGAGSVVP